MFLTRPSLVSRVLSAAALLTLPLALYACGSPSGNTQQATKADGRHVSTRPSAPAASDPVWHYEGAEGPEHWGALSPKFAACGEGRSQSPIDISNPSRGTAPDWKTAFPPATLRIAHHEHMADGINNGHTIQVDYLAADTLTLGDASYQLMQFHFHAPSEHTVSGRHFPMEMHLVHKAADGRLAVVGVLIDRGLQNAAFEPIWANLPARKGIQTHYPAITVDVDAMLPTARTTYRYNGSLTTPPCSEGVTWLLMTTPIQLSPEQIAAFTRLIEGNNRPTQPLNGRPVVTDAVAVTGGDR